MKARSPRAWNDENAACPDLSGTGPRGPSSLHQHFGFAADRERQPPAWSGDALAARPAQLDGAGCGRVVVIPTAGDGVAARGARHVVDRRERTAGVLVGDVHEAVLEGPAAGRVG